MGLRFAYTRALPSLAALHFFCMQDITYAQLAEKKAFLDVLRAHLTGDVTPAWEQGLLALMDNVFSTFFALERPEVITEIQRVTVNRRVIGRNARLQNMSLIKYPQADKHRLCPARTA